jgi:hypothetical protein
MEVPPISISRLESSDSWQKNRYIPDKYPNMVMDFSLHADLRATALTDGCSLLLANCNRSDTGHSMDRSYYGLDGSFQISHAWKIAESTPSQNR